MISPRLVPAKPRFGYHTSKALTSTRGYPLATRGTGSGTRESRLEHRHSSVDMQRLARDIGSLVGGEVDGGRSHVGAAAEPASRDPRQDRLALLVVELVGHCGGDKAWGDAIGGHSALGIFLGDRLDHSNHTGLGGRVVSLSGIAGDTDHRGNADEAAMAPPHHGLHRRPRQAKGGRKVERNDLIPRLVAQLDEKI